MSEHHLDVTFAPLSAEPERTAVVLAGANMTLGSRARALDAAIGGGIVRAAEAAQFKGKAKSSIEILAPSGSPLTRLLVIGVGKAPEASELDWVSLGGSALGAIAARKTERASLVFDVTDTGEHKADEIAAWLAEGAVLRQYTFRKYLTRGETEAGEGGAAAEAVNGTASEEQAAKAQSTRREGVHELIIHCTSPDKARALFQRRRAVANGVFLARDLVNEPANKLGPVEFAERLRELERSGLEVEILEADKLAELGMGALLAVAQGSDRPARVVVMQWHGAKSKRAKPIAFVGKGVVFDTGGISIKPAQGMEDMKGDMGGAACVSGLMLALAERKAAVNAVGLVGLVENMPSGTATRPGDIVTSMSGQTVEVLNTDAEGRLVLADVLWYAQQRFKPKLIVDLATLTGAIMVALGKEYAGLYCNDDKLAADLQEAAKSTGEKVWRMPLDKGYDKMIESKNADMKNIGGRWAGACTAAAFLERFVKDTPWAHIDVAGTAMDAPRTEINPSWGSGWGVRLLDRMVADKHEKG
ncbi:MAG: leucyl aminopeptidase [Pseudomonadota bacterium]